MVIGSERYNPDESAPGWFWCTITNNSINATETNCLCGSRQFRLVKATTAQKARQNENRSKQLRLHAE